LVLPGSRARIVRCGGRYDPQLVKRSSEWVSEWVWTRASFCVFCNFLLHMVVVWFDCQYQCNCNQLSGKVVFEMCREGRQLCSLIRHSAPAKRQRLLHVCRRSVCLACSGECLKQRNHMQQFSAVVTGRKTEWSNSRPSFTVYHDIQKVAKSQLGDETSFAL